MNPDADARLTSLHHWLHSLSSDHGLDLQTLEPASSDASFRRYYRVQSQEGTLIIMDAPPPNEDCRPFLHITELLRAAKLNVPSVLAQDLQQGFLLLSDLGPTTYFQAVQNGLSDTRLQSIYRDALDALVDMQKAGTEGLPEYDQNRLIEELALFPQWYVLTHCNVALSDAEQAMLHDTFTLLAQDNVAQPQVFVHRDFHSPNLMLTERAEHGPNPGIIDYQDALRGPMTYDIASLVMDARTTWEEPQQLDWAIRYWQKARDAGLPISHDFAEFHRAYEWMSLQRNLRILGVFARLSHRDGKHHYLDHMPRVNAYVRQVAVRYREFKPLLQLLDKLDDIQPDVRYTF